MASLCHKAVYEFEDFRLDSAHLMLYQNDREIALAPKVIQTLLALVERPGQVISKEDLMQMVWADSIVEESNLSQNLYLLRKTLGDGKNGKPLIETFRRRGYRFSVPVRRIEAAIPIFNETTISPKGIQTPIQDFRRPVEPQVITPTSSVVALSDWRRETDAHHNDFRRDSNKPRSSSVAFAIRTRHNYAFYCFTGLLVGALGIGYYYFSLGTTIKKMDGKSSIAVLPVKPIDSANRDQIFEIGISDALINQINSTNRLIARPLTATRKYADVDQDAISAGKEQQADYVLASTYQLADGRIRVTAHLSKVAAGQIEETYRVEQPISNVFAMEDAIANEIGKKLLIRFGSTGSGSPTKRGTTNEDAYRLYLDGIYLYDKRTVADAKRAVEKLEQAIQLDPEYAKAWAGKAHAHRSLGNFGGSLSPHDEYIKSIEAIGRALELDENLSDAHSALCENKFFYEYDYEGAERECTRAVELDPNSSVAHEVYSRFLLTRGRFEESISEVKAAIDLEPASLFSQRTYGICLFYARRDSEAVAQFIRVVEMDPNFTAIYHWLINALLARGSEAEAFEWFMRSLSLQKTDETTLKQYRKAYNTSGWNGVGRERVNLFDENKIRSYFLEASLIAHTDDRSKAFEYLEKSLQRREWGIPYLKIDPSLDALRGDPRFDELVQKVGTQ